MTPATLFRTSSGGFEVARDNPSLDILLIEDNPQLRRVLGYILRRDDHAVTEPEGEPECLEMIAATMAAEAPHRFDLVIAEHDLAGILGLSLLGAIRARDRALPFILMGGNLRVQAEARRLGAVALAHPATVESLRAAIARTARPLRAGSTGARRHSQRELEASPPGSGAVTFLGGHAA
jgi:DNA-binding NtrC family response regulator